MKNQTVTNDLSHQMAENLKRAIAEESHGHLSEAVYDQVVDCFYQMRHVWEGACSDMEVAALQIRNELHSSVDHITLAASAIVNQAEEQVTGITVDSTEPAMLPYDYKGLTILIRFLNLLTCGQLARQYQPAMV